jgi:hypothetical protein
VTIPKKKYRDKVKGRLETVKGLFADRDRVQKMMRRVGGFEEGSDFNNKMDALYMLLDRDVPALLEALDQLTENNRQTQEEAE